MLGVERKAARLAMLLTSCGDMMGECPLMLVVCAKAVHTISHERSITSAMQSTVCLEYQYWLSSAFSGFLKATTKGQEALKQQLHLRGKVVQLRWNGQLT